MQQDYVVTPLSRMMCQVYTRGARGCRCCEITGLTTRVMGGAEAGRLANVPAACVGDLSARAGAGARVARRQLSSCLCEGKVRVTMHCNPG